MYFTHRGQNIKDFTAGGFCANIDTHMYLLSRWILNALLLMAVAYIVPGIAVSGVYVALIVAILLGLVNAIIRPVLIVLTLPINVLTLGLFVFVINGLLFWFVASFVEGFSVDGFVPAFVGALLLTAFSWVGNKFIKGRQEE